MPGIPSSGEEGRGDARDRRSFPVSGLFTPFPPYVIKFFCEYDLDLIGEMWSDLSHLPVHERLEALGQKLKEYSLSKAPSVHTSDDEEDEDDDEYDEEDDEDEDREGLKLMDDERKPICAEEHQIINSECEKECKKPRLAESDDRNGEEARGLANK